MLLFASWNAWEAQPNSGLQSTTAAAVRAGSVPQCLQSQWQIAIRPQASKKLSQAELKYPCWSAVPWGQCYVLPETKRRAHFQSQRLLCPIKENSRLQLGKKQEKETQPQRARLHSKCSLKKRGHAPRRRLLAPSCSHGSSYFALEGGNAIPKRDHPYFKPRAAG